MSGKARYAVEATADSVTLDACPSCGGESRKLRTPERWIGEEFFRGGPWGLERCVACGLVYTNPRPSESLLAQFYSTDGYAPHQSDFHLRRLVDYFASRIEHYHPTIRRGRFLDYGCGGGSLLGECARRGWNASGYDVATPAIKACRSRGMEATNDTAALPAPVDAIMMCHSLEHVSRMDEPLALFRRILKPDSGRLFIAVPNIRSLRAWLSPPMATRLIGAEERYQSFPIHLSYFSASSLKRLLARHGFEAVAVESYSFGIDSYFRSSGGGQSPAAGGGAPPVRSQNGGLKQITKRAIRGAFMGAGLGENLLGVFRQNTLG